MRESVDREVGNMAGNVGRVMAVHHSALMVPDLLVMYAEPGPGRPVTMASVGAGRRDSAGRNGFTSGAPTVVERPLPVYGIVSLLSVPPWSTTVSPSMVRENWS